MTWKKFGEATWYSFVLVFMLLLLRGTSSGQSLVAVHESGARAVDVQADKPRPIASVTKVMTAMLVVEAGLDPGRLVTIARGESTPRLRRGQKVSVGDLMALLLLSSDNGAAKALARTAAGSIQAFVGRMNARAQGLGMGATRYSDPAGLLASNVSTAAEQARLLRLAVEYDSVGALMRTAQAVVRVGTRAMTIRNTNRLLRDPGLEVVAGKTGTTRRAGYCLATMIKAPDGEEVTVVVLGARTATGRFSRAVDAFKQTIGG
jgi:D-alanyl-D-alanine endopeptidase (penicillin-binding protein 7)